MIQRIQSIWLLLAAACAFAGLKFPYYSGTNANGATSYQLTGTENFLLMITTIAVGGLALFIIFLFKRRPLQIKLCALGIFLQALLIFLYYRQVNQFQSGTFALTSILQMISLLAFVLAARAINKDQKLVKDSDRLR